MATKQQILDLIDTVAINFTDYDRREDEEVNVDDLHNAVAQGVVTVQELAAEFEKKLKQYLS